MEYKTNSNIRELGVGVISPNDDILDLLGSDLTHAYRGKIQSKEEPDQHWRQHDARSGSRLGSMYIMSTYDNAEQ